MTVFKRVYINNITAYIAEISSYLNKYERQIDDSSLFLKYKKMKLRREDFVVDKEERGEEILYLTNIIDAAYEKRYIEEADMLLEREFETIKNDIQKENINSKTFYENSIDQFKTQFEPSSVGEVEFFMQNNSFQFSNQYIKNLHDFYAQNISALEFLQSNFNKFLREKNENICIAIKELFGTHKNTILYKNEPVFLILYYLLRAGQREEIRNYMKERREFLSMIDNEFYLSFSDYNENRYSNKTNNSHEEEDIYKSVLIDIMAGRRAINFLNEHEILRTFDDYLFHRLILNEDEQMIIMDIEEMKNMNCLIYINGLFRNTDTMSSYILNNIGLLVSLNEIFILFKQIFNSIERSDFNYYFIDFIFLILNRFSQKDLIIDILNEIDRPYLLTSISSNIIKYNLFELINISLEKTKILNYNIIRRTVEILIELEKFEILLDNPLYLDYLSNKNIALQNIIIGEYIKFLRGSMENEFIYQNIYDRLKIEGGISEDYISILDKFKLFIQSKERDDKLEIIRGSILNNLDSEFFIRNIHFLRRGDMKLLIERVVEETVNAIKFSFDREISANLLRIISILNLSESVSKLVGEQLVVLL